MPKALLLLLELPELIHRKLKVLKLFTMKLLRVQVRTSSAVVPSNLLPNLSKTTKRTVSRIFQALKSTSVKKDSAERRESSWRKEGPKMKQIGRIGRA
jgi:hypothetical protein